MRSIIRLSYALARLVIFLLATHVGRIIAGSALIVAGTIYGLTSHTVVYQQAPLGSYQVVTIYDGAYYLQQNGSSTYYIVNLEGFTPSMQDAPFTVGGYSYLSSLAYKSDSASNVTITLADGSRASGPAYTVAQLAIAGTGGQPAQTFTSADYSQHPRGYYDSHWQVGAVLIGIGILFLLFTFLAPLIADTITGKREKKEKPDEFLGIIKR